MRERGCSAILYVRAPPSGLKDSFTGAPWAACAPPLAVRSAFGFSTSHSPWMHSQIRPAAALSDLKPFTGFTTERLFQMLTSRSGGQAAASFTSSARLVKDSAPAPNGSFGVVRRREGDDV